MGENSGPAPAAEDRINAIPTVQVTTEQERRSFLFVIADWRMLVCLQVIIYNVLFVWMISKREIKRSVCHVRIIFTKLVFFDGFDWWVSSPDERKRDLRSWFYLAWNVSNVSSDLRRQQYQSRNVYEFPSSSSSSLLGGFASDGFRLMTSLVCVQRKTPRYIFLFAFSLSLLSLSE